MINFHIGVLIGVGGLPPGTQCVRTLLIGHSCRDAVARTLWSGHSYYYFCYCDQQADKCPKKVCISISSFETQNLDVRQKRKPDIPWTLIRLLVQY